MIGTHKNPCCRLHCQWGAYLVFSGAIDYGEVTFPPNPTSLMWCFIPTKNISSVIHRKQTGHWNTTWESSHTDLYWPQAAQVGMPFPVLLSPLTTWSKYLNQWVLHILMSWPQSIFLCFFLLFEVTCLLEPSDVRISITWSCWHGEWPFKSIPGCETSWIC